MKTKPKIKGLIVSYWFYPKNIVASHRLYSFYNELNKIEDFEVDVLCPKWEGELKIEKSGELYFTHEDNTEVIYTSVTKKGGLKNFLKETIAKDTLKLDLFKRFSPGEFYKNAIERLKTIDLNKFDFVVTSYGPIDSIHIGKYIKQNNPNIYWINDFRDLFSLNKYNDYGVASAWVRNKEKELISNCNAIIGVSNSLVKRLQDFHKTSNFAYKVIYNGYIENESIEKYDSLVEKIISYTGSVYAGKRDCKEVLNWLNSSSQFEGYKIIFAVFSPEDKRYLENLAEELNLSDFRIEYKLSYEESIDLQRRSEFCLLLNNPSGSDNEALPVKLFEYLYLKKRIIFSGHPDAEAYQLIRNLKIGEHFKNINGPLQEEVNWGLAKLFSRKSIANDLADFIRFNLNIEN